ncbi:MAG: STAS domain-containing protein, partial [Planctomycetota bacterium]
MKIEIREQAGVHVVRLSGELTEDSGVVEAVSDLIAQPRARVILDLTAVPFINSNGLGDLVRVTAQANVQEGRVVLANATPFVAGVMETTQLNRFFEICATKEEALERLEAP